jgi:hypothetical protein
MVCALTVTKGDYVVNDSSSVFNIIFSFGRVWSIKLSTAVETLMILQIKNYFFGV